MQNNQTDELPIVKQCELLSINRSSLYYKPKVANESNLCELILKIWLDDQSLGYRMITAHLREYHDMIINHKRVRRIMHKLKIMGIMPKRNLSKNKHPQYKYPYLLRNLLINQANMVWSTDITYIKLPSGYMYLMVIIDVHSRCILDYQLSNTLDASFCIECLNRCIGKYGAPAIMNTDQGCQYTSHQWIDTLKHNQILVSMDGKGRWADNIWVERFWRTIKYCNIFMHGAETVVELKGLISQFIKYYNEKRLHSVHGYKTPMYMYTQSIESNKGKLYQYIYENNDDGKLVA